MKNISDIDTNFKLKTDINKEGLRFYNCESEPFKIYGIYKENGKFRRIPEKVAQSVSEGVLFLHANTAGGRVRFITDSPYVAISAKMENIGKMSHFALTGSAGFDMYIKDEYFRSFIPPFDLDDGYESIVEFEDRKMREITINFPLYSDVCDLYIGLDENAVISEPVPYINEKSVVYYGSSITQGGCASRPGNAYQAFISRRFNLDFINLGFSGSARAEDAIIDYIKKLDMSIFVYDYDYNAPSIEHLAKTHEKMFKAIREENPELPIIIASRPEYSLSEAEKKRFDIIETTYKNAVENGDKNVYLIDGKTLMAICGGAGTVDHCHPTDFGFASMAKAIGDVIGEILG